MSKQSPQSDDEKDSSIDDKLKEVYCEGDIIMHREAYDPNPRTFEGIPEHWHETIKMRNPETCRVKLIFKCCFSGCNSVFKKSCNLRDHFRKHTG
jgi:hypothetical protein